MRIHIIIWCLLRTMIVCNSVCTSVCTTVDCPVASLFTPLTCCELFTTSPSSNITQVSARHQLPGKGSCRYYSMHDIHVESRYNEVVPVFGCLGGHDKFARRPLSASAVSIMV
ncbi:hypothetical protein F4859DRAFT_481499 [Xylaria cf. heliscus]|nr:hypothetical protein F4859DRAFT_481499 [Xylaria cf. heliscus]